MTVSKFSFVFRFLLLLLVLSSLQNCHVQGCSKKQSGSSSSSSSSSSSWSPLSFSMGDIIACTMAFNKWANAFNVKHVMLAISSEEIVHVWDQEDTSDGTFVRVKQNKFESFKNSTGMNNCKVITKSYNNKMASVVHPYSAGTAAERAKRDLGRRVMYGLIRCNCEHWVSFWKYGEGKAWSMQSGFYMSYWCANQLNFE